MGMKITEALAEVKTLNKRISKKRENICKYLVRFDSVKDPLGDGGSEKFVVEQKQAHDDLVGRIVQIRTAIQITNNRTSLTVCGQTRTIAEWLTWRKECAGLDRGLIDKMLSSIRNARDQSEKFKRETEADGDKSQYDLFVGYDEGTLVKAEEAFEKIVSDLDGKLSLINATTDISDKDFNTIDSLPD